MTTDRGPTGSQFNGAASRRRSRRWAGPLALAGLVGVLPLASGCSDTIALATGSGAAAGGVISVATLSATDKLVTDHVVSLVTGHDCSTVRYFDGGYYCVPPAAPNDPVETRLYCYRSIAGITCYDTKVPGEDARLVSDPRHVVGARTVRGPAVDQIPGQH